MIKRRNLTNLQNKNGIIQRHVKQTLQEKGRNWTWEFWRWETT